MVFYICSSGNNSCNVLVEYRLVQAILPSNLKQKIKYIVAEISDKTIKEYILAEINNLFYTPISLNDIIILNIQCLTHNCRVEEKPENILHRKPKWAKKILPNKIFTNYDFGNKRKNNLFALSFILAYNLRKGNYIRVNTESSGSNYTTVESLKMYINRMYNMLNNNGSNVRFVYITPRTDHTLYIEDELEEINETNTMIEDDECFEDADKTVNKRNGVIRISIKYLMNLTPSRIYQLLNVYWLGDRDNEYSSRYIDLEDFADQTYSQELLEEIIGNENNILYEIET